MDRLQEVRKNIAETNLHAEEARLASIYAEANLTMGEAAVNRSREILETAQSYLETEGTEALQRAVERSLKFGQQSERMSQTARDARLAAEALEDAAKAIEVTAQMALNMSTSAYNLARDAVDQQKNTSHEIGIDFHQLFQLDIGITSIIKLISTAYSHKSLYIKCNGLSIQMITICVDEKI